jgi:nucleotide-binding universal stress UspA family protein
VPAATPLELYKAAETTPAPGVLQAVADTQADLLVLIARPRSFWSGLFHRSVTAAVLRRSTVPVLLLPAEPLD